MNGRILRQLVAACVLACAGMARAAAGGEVYDVVVAGGTSYGVAAAVEAAKGGARVCLVAPRATLGEDLAGTLRLKPSDGAALPADLRARLYAANPAARNSFGGATPLQIKKALDAALIEAGVTFRCWTQPCEVAADGDGAVTGLWVAGRDGRRLVRAKTVIDATPRAGLARRAGVLPPLPGGVYTVVRHVVSGTRPQAEGLTATAASEVERIPLTEKQPQLRPAPDLPDVIDARLWRCEKACTLADGSARSFARLEQEMRDATWTRDQVDAGDFCFFAQPPAGCGRAHRITRVPPRAPTPVPTLAEVDVLVVGGGTAGAPAAIAAARKGLKTLCVEYAGRLGGVMTEGAIGLYCFGLRRGFTAELDAALKTMGAVYGVCKAEWFRAEARRAGAEIWLAAQATGAVTEGARVVGATVALADGTYGVVRAKAVIDATGYALLAASAGERTEFLSADEISVQGAGSTPRLLGRSYQNTDALFVDDTDPADISYEWLRARTSFGPHVWDQAAVVNSRERRRMHGAYYVTVQDAMGGRNYPDLIGVTYSNFDTHGQTVDPQFFVEDPGHQGRRVNLPYRALLPAKVDGLLVTGLGMSAHRDAMPILRMQPDVQNQGYTAGLAAAQAVRTGVALRAIDVKALQRELVGKGILHAEELKEPEAFPLSDEKLAAAVAALGTDYRDLAKVLSDRTRARPLLERAYAAAADTGARRVYAHVLGLVGSASGWKDLVAALDGASAWDAGWNFRGMHQFGRSVSWMDSYLIALGACGRALKGNAAVIGAVRRKAALLTGESRYSHFRAVAKAAEGIGDPALAPDLARLLALPKVGGHALAPRAVPPIAGYEKDISHLGVADQERSDCLRELSVARALFRLGDPTGAARKALEAYAADPRRVYAAHARAVLSGRLSD